MNDGVRTIAFKPDDDSLYLIGTDEGHIYLCTTEYSTAFIMAYHAHITPVNTVVWNPFYPTLFLSCASEQTIYFWHVDQTGEGCSSGELVTSPSPEPILSYDCGYQVNDISWAPYSSTVFALGEESSHLSLSHLYFSDWGRRGESVRPPHQQIQTNLQTEDHHVSRRRPQQDRLQHLRARDRGGGHRGDDTQPQTVTKPPQEDQGEYQGGTEQQSQGNTVSCSSRYHQAIIILYSVERQR